MATKLEVLFTPAEVVALPDRDLSHTTCVVFDILRATSVFVTALANGAVSVRPVAEIADAVAACRTDPTILLAGERQGLRLRAADSGGIDFDLGNSPREFTETAVRGRRIISTTTNGTRALRACAGAARTFAGSFLNLTATVEHLSKLAPAHILLVCAGTGNAMALEDVTAAGALCEALKAIGFETDTGDSAQIATQAFVQVRSGLLPALANSQNGRRLLSIPDLREDVSFCCQMSVMNVVVKMDRNGLLQRVDGNAQN